MLIIIGPLTTNKSSQSDKVWAIRSSKRSWDLGSLKADKSGELKFAGEKYFGTPGAAVESLFKEFVRDIDVTVDLTASRDKQIKELLKVIILIARASFIINQRVNSLGITISYNPAAKVDEMAEVYDMSDAEKSRVYEILSSKVPNLNAISGPLIDMSEGTPYSPETFDEKEEEVYVD